MALCSAGILAVEIWEANTDDALLSSVASPDSSQANAFPSRLPKAFQMFSSLRETFPEVSGYCHCADSLGRELADTGKYSPASDPLTGVALGSQGRGQITSTTLQIHFGTSVSFFQGERRL